MHVKCRATGRDNCFPYLLLSDFVYVDGIVYLYGPIWGLV